MHDGMRWCFACVILIGLCGCTGSGTIHTMPYRRSDLPPDEPLIEKIAIDEAYYWQEDGGALNVVLRRRSESLLGEMFSNEFALSLVLDGLPAGSERLYHVRMREAQSVSRYGADRRRARSITGVVVIHAPKHGTLEGRFHLVMHQQRFTALTGWTPASVFRGTRLIRAGRFVAVHDPERGRPIRDMTEENFPRPLPREQRPKIERLELYPSTQPGTP